MRLCSLNIRRGFFNKKTELENIVKNSNIDVVCLQEVDLNFIDEKYPPVLEGFKTYYPFQSNKQKTRALTFVKEELSEYCSQDEFDLKNNDIQTVQLGLKLSNSNHW